MSYDISFRVKVEGTDRYMDVGCDANITWNVKELIKQSSGWDIKNEDFNGLVKDLIPKIRHGLTELELHPEKYKQYESPNGWGTISGTINFYRDIINDWEFLLGGDRDIAEAALVYVS